MKVTILLILTMLGGPALADMCQRCAETDHLLARMNSVKPDFGNRATIDAQESILSSGSDIIFALLKQKQLNFETSKSLLTLIAKILPYDQSSMIVQDNIQRFQHFYAPCDQNPFRKALDQIVIDKKISAGERANMLKWFDVDSAPFTCK